MKQIQTNLASADVSEYQLTMTYCGTVKNGVVVLPPEAKLPEGAEVEVHSVELTAADDPFLAAVQKVAKLRHHWPRDFSRNLDHYLYGVPKQS